MRVHGSLTRRPVQPPASACPNCYANGTLLPFFNGDLVLPFECACGCRWVTSRKNAVAHALWLDRANQRMARNVGDL